MVKDDNLEPEHLRKLFIGGLGYHTTDESLKDYFEQFGEIVDVVVMKDPQTKRSRGFGFVAFSQSYMVDDAQKNRPHKLDGRTVDTKRAVPRDEIGKPEAGAVVKKIFVGGLKDISEEDLQDIFSQFGEVTSVSIPVERDTQKKRGFAFVEFSDPDAADKACLHKDLIISGKRVDVKKALDRNEMNRMGSFGGPRGSYGGPSRGGGRGGWSGGRGDSFNGNRGGGWGDNQGGYGYGGGYGGGGGQSWGGNQGGGWGGNQGGGGNWGGNQGGGGGWNGWGGNQNEFGNNYGQYNGGGPMRGQGNYQSSRSGPYGGGPDGRRY